MTNEDYLFLELVKNKIQEKPELIGYVINAMTSGIDEKVKKANEFASDMECLAITSISMLNNKVVSSKMKKEFEELALSKLEKHKFKTFFEWKWAIKEKDK